MSQLNNNMRLKFLAKNLKFNTQGIGCARKHWKLRESALVAMASENLPTLRKGDKFWLREFWSEQSIQPPKLYKKEPNTWYVQIEILEDLG
jgi:hypothetical protein